MIKIDAGCGLAWKTKIEAREQIERALASASIEYDKIVEIVI